MKSILLSVFVVTTIVVLNCGVSCLQRYHEFEEKFWGIEENLDKFQDMFYPTNAASPNFVFVDYSCINESNEAIINCIHTKHTPLSYVNFPHKFHQ